MELVKEIRTYEYITNYMFFFTFKIILTVIFYTFIFVKDEMHVDFFT